MAIGIRFDLRVPMRDGITLSADVYCPEGDGPWPAIVLRTPYNKSDANQLELGRCWAEHGYVVAYHDVRGREDFDGVEMQVARQTIYHTEEYPSALVLPVVPDRAEDCGSRPGE